jgi:hypothetical protein
VIASLLLQTGELETFQRGVREQFQRGNTVQGILIAMAAASALAVVVYFLNARQQRVKKPPRPTDPNRLFSRLLDRLELSWTDRRWLERIAQDLELAHPTVILLSPAFFDECVQTWRQARPGAAPGVDKRALVGLRARLFPATSPLIVGDKS